MQFKVKNNRVFFRDYDLSEYMTIKEINIDIEENISYVTAEFKADIDVTSNGIFLAMVQDMEEGNLIDLKEHIEEALERINNDSWTMD